MSPDLRTPQEHPGIPGGSLGWASYPLAVWIMDGWMKVNTEITYGCNIFFVTGDTSPQCFNIQSNISTS